MYIYVKKKKKDVSCNLIGYIQYVFKCSQFSKIELFLVIFYVYVIIIIDCIGYEQEMI